jgi:hypothetical protein
MCKGRSGSHFWRRAGADALSPFGWVLSSKFTLSLELGKPCFFRLELILAGSHLTSTVSSTLKFEEHVLERLWSVKVLCFAASRNLYHVMLPSIPIGGNPIELNSPIPNSTISRDHRSNQRLARHFAHSHCQALLTSTEF